MSNLEDLSDFIDKKNVLWYHAGNEVVISFKDSKKSEQFCKLLHKIGDANEKRTGC